MAAIASTAELPFEARDPWALLGVDPARPATSTDEDWDAFGYTRLPRLVLECDGGARRTVASPLVLALHSEDDAPALQADIELAFWLDEPDALGRSVVISAPLSAFLATWLPRLTGSPQPRPGAVVLALCNPLGTRIPRPPTVPEGVPLWYALGDVASWGESVGGDESMVFGLTAPRWERV